MCYASKQKTIANSVTTEIWYHKTKGNVITSSQSLDVMDTLKADFW